MEGQPHPGLTHKLKPPENYLVEEKITEHKVEKIILIVIIILIG